MKTMTVDGFHAKIEYDEELDLLRGEILGFNGGADFDGKNPKELRAEFKKSLQVFLDVCKEKASIPKEISRANSTCAFLPSCMSNWLLRRRHRAKVSTCWRKKLCSCVWRLDIASKRLVVC